MDLVTVTINHKGKTLPFTAVRSENQIAILKRIFDNICYPRLDFIAGEVSTVIDAGANIGSAALYLAFSYPMARILAYEPVKRTFDILARNAALEARIVPIHAGLSDAAGEATIHFGGLGGETSSLFAGFETFPVTETVTLRRAADEFAAAVGEAPGWVVLKLDTEGMELPILKDLLPQLERVAAVYLEYHSEADRVAIERLLTDHGFALFAGAANQPHRGELTYVRGRLISERSNWDRYAIQRT